jgi:hypothetical protein
MCRKNHRAWSACRLVVLSDRNTSMTEGRQEVGADTTRSKSAFVFGVSGHRDLVASDLSELRQQLREIFVRSMSAHPNAPFELLSPLAEGADRIAAEEALLLGITLVVPMPMTQAEYERDFTSADSLEAFRRLLKAADAQFVVNEVPATEDADERTARYAAVGDYIARNSHLLILLWDGKENQKIGGTAWVRMRREHWAHLAKKSGHATTLETVHIPTRRAAAVPR